MHFTEQYLLEPTNPVTVNLIGSGGTGSRVLTALAETNFLLHALGHPGLDVQVFDNDLVTEPNVLKQRFAPAEVGLFKSVARVNNVNRWCGTNWKAVPYQFNRENLSLFKDRGTANIFISCVDNVQSRFELAGLLSDFQNEGLDKRYRPFYWMDYGNSQYTGQVILSTVGKIKQPASKVYKTIDVLPFVTDSYKSQLDAAASEDNSPSCSHREALQNQDLFINGSLCQMGSSLLWHLFQNYRTPYRGFFHNIATFQTQPIKVG